MQARQLYVPQLTSIFTLNQKLLQNIHSHSLCFFCLAQGNVQVPVQTIYETVILQDKLKKIM